MSVDFLIDCGATTSLISSDKFKGIGTNRAFQLQPANVLKTVNGEPTNVTGRVDLIVEMNAEHLIFLLLFAILMRMAYWVKIFSGKMWMMLTIKILLDDNFSSAVGWWHGEPNLSC